MSSGNLTVSSWPGSLGYLLIPILNVWELQKTPKIPRISISSIPLPQILNVMGSHFVPTALLSEIPSLALVLPSFAHFLL